MQLVPYLDVFKSKDKITNETELNIVIAVMYFATLCFICELAMALTVTWKFLIRQRKYKIWPLLMFYILTISLAAMRIYGSSFYFFILIEKELFGQLLIPIIKLNLGAVQCWMLFELGLRVSLNIKLMANLQRCVVS